VLDATVFITGDVLGGFDTNWQRVDGARSVIESSSINEAFYISDAPEVALVGLDIQAGDQAMAAQSVGDLEVWDVVGAGEDGVLANGSLRVGLSTIAAGSLAASGVLDVEVFNSDLTGNPTLWAGENARVVRSRLRTASAIWHDQGSDGTRQLQVVSSTMTVSADNAPRVWFLTSGEARAWGSTMKQVPLDVLATPPGVELGDGSIRLVNVAIGSPTALIDRLSDGGTFALEGVVAAAECGVRQGRCLQATDADACATPGCQAWTVTAVDGFLPSDDPDRLSSPDLGNGVAYPPDAPTAVSGDLLGNCRDFSQLTVGAFEPDI
jgi:hypothetical protein